MLLSVLSGPGHGLRVLDVGCGNGYLGAILAERGYEVTGVERPGGWAPPFPQKVRLIEADLEAGLPDLAATYHYILCADILEHLQDPGRLLRQMRTVLEPGGMVIGSLPNSGNIWFRLNVLAGRFPQDDKGLFDRTHVRFYMWKGWRTLFADSGYRIRRMEPTAIPVGLLAPPSLADSLPLRIAESVSYGLARVWTKMFAYQFVVRAEPCQEACRENTR